MTATRNNERSPGGPASVPHLKPKAAPVSPGTRIVLVVCWIAIVTLLPMQLWKWQLFNALVLSWLFWKTQLNCRQWLCRHKLLISSVLLMSVGLIGQPDWLLRIWNFAIKASLSLGIMTLLLHVTPLTDFFEGLRQLRFPRIGVELLAFLARYFVVLSEEWRRMQLARHARTFRHRPAREFISIAQSLGWLFVRAYGRAEQVHQAMLARGYQLH